MLEETEELKKSAPRRIVLWEQDIVTLTETVGWFVDHLAFALWENPEAGGIVGSVITSLPKPVLDAMVERLEECKSPSGEWRWPPAGQPLTFPIGPGPWRVADDAQVVALNRLAVLLCRGGSRADKTSSGEG
jgi:hypothetical protein